VVMANKKELAKVSTSGPVLRGNIADLQPTRTSLAPPRPSISTPTRRIKQSHSDIVDSPY
jgi:hypothetical protein